MLDIKNKNGNKTGSTGATGATGNMGNIENPFAGCTVVVTGTLTNFTRSGINARIEELGAKAGSAVSKNTGYLICGDKAGSKLDKARVLGITVLSEQQFLDMAEGLCSADSMEKGGKSHAQAV